MNEEALNTPLSPAESQASTANTQPETSGNNVHRLTLYGVPVHLVGTAHISQKSAEEVEQLIAQERPSHVAVELCEARAQSIKNPDDWRKMDLFQVIRTNRATLLLFNIILSSFQRKLGEQVGIKPGTEMVRAMDAAETTGSKVVLADRNIQTTLRRTWRRLGLWDKAKMLIEGIGALVWSPEMDAEEVEALKGKNMLAEVMDQFAKAFPRVKEVLIDERDVYLAEHIRQSAEEASKASPQNSKADAPQPAVVAVVGAGHVPGILKTLESEAPNDLTPLDAIPRASIWGKVIQWGIPLLVLGLITYGFTTSGADVSWEMVKIWVLANGVLSALGALLALAHPLTILTAFVAAPITSLNPMVAAGWVAGMAEIFLRKPKVADFEELAAGLKTFGQFWRNGVIRVLLVVALANVGSSIGTFVGIPFMSALLG